MSQILEKQKTTELTIFKRKVQKVIDTIRSHGDIEQGFGALNRDNKLCVSGLLMFLGGIPKSDFHGISGFVDIKRLYEFSDADMYKTITNHHCEKEYNTTIPVSMSNLFYLNDLEHSFDEIADILQKGIDEL